MVFMWCPECQFQRDGSKGREPQMKPREETDLTEIEQMLSIFMLTYTTSALDLGDSRFEVFFFLKEGKVMTFLNTIQLYSIR